MFFPPVAVVVAAVALAIDYWAVSVADWWISQAAPAARWSLVSVESLPVYASSASFGDELAGRMLTNSTISTSSACTASASPAFEGVGLWRRREPVVDPRCDESRYEEIQDIDSVVRQVRHRDFPRFRLSVECRGAISASDLPGSVSQEPAPQKS